MGLFPLACLHLRFSVVFLLVCSVWVDRWNVQLVLSVGVVRRRCPLSVGVVRWRCPSALSVGVVRWRCPVALSGGVVRWRCPVALFVGVLCRRSPWALSVEWFCSFIASAVSFGGNSCGRLVICAVLSRVVICAFRCWGGVVSGSIRGCVGVAPGLCRSEK